MDGVPADLPCGIEPQHHRGISTMTAVDRRIVLSLRLRTTASSRPDQDATKPGPYPPISVAPNRSTITARRTGPADTDVSKPSLRFRTTAPSQRVHASRAAADGGRPLQSRTAAPSRHHMAGLIGTLMLLPLRSRTAAPPRRLARKRRPGLVRTTSAFQKPAPYDAIQPSGLDTVVKCLSTPNRSPHHGVCMAPLVLASLAPSLRPAPQHHHGNHAAEKAYPDPRLSLRSRTAAQPQLQPRPGCGKTDLPPLRSRTAAPLRRPQLRRNLRTHHHYLCGTEPQHHRGGVGKTCIAGRLVPPLWSHATAPSQAFRVVRIGRRHLPSLWPIATAPSRHPQLDHRATNRRPLRPFATAPSRPPPGGRAAHRGQAASAVSYRSTIAATRPTQWP